LTSTIKFRGVSLRYEGGTRAIDELDLEVAPGSFVALIGPSGCGKSSALRLAAGLAQPTTGTVEGGPPPIAFVFQDPTLLPWRSVADNIGLPLELAGAIDRAAVAAVIERVGLSGFEDHYPRELSGGMRMRVSLARALVTRPNAMLLDEPFAALDEITRHKLQEDLLTAHAAAGFTALFVTHSVLEAAFLADRVVVMTARPGRIAAIIEVDRPRPRAPGLRTDPDFMREVGQIGRVLAEQVH
jgi:NitT/TauT family transport system ATP-binding protein